MKFTKTLIHYLSHFIVISEQYAEEKMLKDRCRKLHTEKQQLDKERETLTKKIQVFLSFIYPILYRYCSMLSKNFHTILAHYSYIELMHVVLERSIVNTE